MEDLTKVLEEQLEFLAEVSKNCEPALLKDITEAMINIYTVLNNFKAEKGKLSSQSDSKIENVNIEKITNSIMNHIRTLQQRHCTIIPV